MIRLKIYTLSDYSKQLLRKNLIDAAVPFAQAGTAFLLPDINTFDHRKVYDGLWIGADANIEMQEIATDFDRTEPLVIHHH